MIANLGVARDARRSRRPSKPLLGVDGFYINASSPSIELAAELALAMTNSESQRVWTDVGGHVPADTTVEVSDEHVAAFQATAPNTVPRPQVKELDNFWGNFGDAQAKITETGADPVTATADACAAMNEANGM